MRPVLQQLRGSGFCAWRSKTTPGLDSNLRQLATAAAKITMAIWAGQMSTCSLNLQRIARKTPIYPFETVASATPHLPMHVIAIFSPIAHSTALLAMLHQYDLCQVSLREALNILVDWHIHLR